MRNLIIITSALFLFASCSKNKTAEITQINENSYDHQWFFYKNEGFENTTLPQKSALSSLKPWTETLRTSDANTDENGNGYLVVNRMGVIYIQKDGEPVLIQDYELFANTTASTLIFDKNNPYITLSRSSFFNKDANLNNSTTEDKNRPFLIRISSTERAFFPVITYGDLSLSNGGEITGTYYDGKNFVSCIKRQEREKTFFSYIKFYSNENLESLAPYTVTSKINLTQTSEQHYRNLNSPVKFSSSPLRLKKLLSSIPSDFDFAVYCKNSGGYSQRLYSSNTDSEGILKAWAIICDGWICCVFSDGTTYFNGALDGRNILNKGKNIAFRLPKLPENYIYGPFCIAGNKLCVAWEESDFYKTGRSGFLVVDLGKVLYGDL